MRRFLPLLILSAASALPSGHAQEPLAEAACVAALSTEQEFFSRLPERLGKLLSNERVKRHLVLNRSEYLKLSYQLDRSLQSGGSTRAFTYGQLEVMMSVSLEEKSDRLVLTIGRVQHENLHIGEVATNGYDFLYLLQGLTHWAFSRSASQKVKSVEIRGENLQNLRLIETLKGLGFRATGGPSADCIVMAGFSGASGMLVGAFVVQVSGHDSAENFLYGTLGGGILGATLFSTKVCLGPQGRDYRLTVHLDSR